MNYKVSSSDSNTYLIGSQYIGTDKVDLVYLTCLEEDNYNPLFTAFLNGLLKLFLNDVEVSKPMPLISKTIQYDIDGIPTDDSFLNLDFESKKRIAKFGGDSNTLSIIDSSYDSKMIDGQNFYRVKRAQLINMVNSGGITLDEALVIDGKIQSVRNSLLFGDWLSAKKEIEDSVIEGAYTQLIKDEYVSEITSYVIQNY